MNPEVITIESLQEVLGKPRVKDKPFVCDIPGCRKAFIKNKTLELHLRTHTDERPFKCPETGCGQMYTRSWHLRRHQSKAHSIKEKHLWPCEYTSCGKNYHCRDALKKHVAIIHLEHGGRHFCRVCDLSFSKHQRLRIHMYQHTGVLPYSCAHLGCGRSFLLPSKLRAHEKVHTGYKCEKCPSATFPTWSALRKHFHGSHSLKRCPLCDKTFTRNFHLECHLKTHEDSRNAICCPNEGCEKSYFEEKNLNAHIKAAHGNIRFSCRECDREFLSKQALRRHGKKCLQGRTPRQPKRGSERKPRKDKGLPRKKAASLLSGYESNEKIRYQLALADDEHMMDEMAVASCIQELLHTVLATAK